MTQSLDEAFRQGDPSLFRAELGWYFQRVADHPAPGTVRITHVNQDGDELVVDLDPGTWAALTACVSATDDVDAALALHQGYTPITIKIADGRYIKRDDLERILDRVEAND